MQWGRTENRQPAGMPSPGVTMARAWSGRWACGITCVLSSNFPFSNAHWPLVVRVTVRNFRTIRWRRVFCLRLCSCTLYGGTLTTTPYSAHNGAGVVVTNILAYRRCFHSRTVPACSRPVFRVPTRPLEQCVVFIRHHSGGRSTPSVL